MMTRSSKIDVTTMSHVVENISRWVFNLSYPQRFKWYYRHSIVYKVLSQGSFDFGLVKVGVWSDRFGPVFGKTNVLNDDISISLLGLVFKIFQ